MIKLKLQSTIGSLVFLMFISTGYSTDKVKVLIIDGINNHDWAGMTKMFVPLIKKTGRFEVDVSTTPQSERRKKNDPRGPVTEKEKEEIKQGWKKWDPNFSKYDTVLLNFNGQFWPEKVLENFINFVKNGGGVVVIHAAVTSFKQSKEFNEMIGLGWRVARFGFRIYLDDNGKIVKVPPGGKKDPGTGHPKKFEYIVKIRQPEHPVMKGMPLEWLHAEEELYSRLRGPAKNLTVLATAFCDSKKAGEKATDKHEPVAYFTTFGKGKVFSTVLGHKMNKPNLVDKGIKCVGFQTIMTRALEWTATGRVTIPIPDNFPTKDKVSIVD